MTLFDARVVRPSTSKDKSETSVTPGMVTAAELHHKAQARLQAQQKRGFCELCEVKCDDIDMVRMATLGITRCARCVNRRMSLK